MTKMWVRVLRTVTIVLAVLALCVVFAMTALPTIAAAIGLSPPILAGLVTIVLLATAIALMWASRQVVLTRLTRWTRLRLHQYNVWQRLACLTLIVALTMLFTISALGLVISISGLTEFSPTLVAGLMLVLAVGLTTLSTWIGHAVRRLAYVVCWIGRTMRQNALSMAAGCGWLASRVNITGHRFGSDAMMTAHWPDHHCAGAGVPYYNTERMLSACGAA